MSTEYNMRAAKGQALNLAVNDAIAVGKTDNTIYIFTKYLHYYALSNLIQEATIEEMRAEVAKKR